MPRARRDTRVPRLEAPPVGAVLMNTPRGAVVGLAELILVQVLPERSVAAGCPKYEDLRLGKGIFQKRVRKTGCVRVFQSAGYSRLVPHGHSWARRLRLLACCVKQSQTCRAWLFIVGWPSGKLALFVPCSVCVFIGSVAWLLVDVGLFVW